MLLLQTKFSKTGQKAKPYLTPNEIAREVIRIDQYFINKEVLSLTDAFTKVRYGNKTLDVEDVDKCIGFYKSMKNKIGEDLGFWENLLLKLNMFSLLTRRVQSKIEDNKKERS